MPSRPRLFVAFWAASLAACAPADPAAPSGTTRLRAVLSSAKPSFASSVDAVVTVTLENLGSSPAKLNMTVLTNPVLSLAIQDEKGRPVPTVPPSVPPLHPTFADLKPGERLVFTHSLHMFDPPLPRGAYTVVVKDLPSNSLTLKIASED